MFKRLLCSLLLWGCATNPKIATLKQNRFSLFPRGDYQQTVAVKVAKGEKVEDFDFNAIVKKEQKKFYLYGYSPFGMTLFKMDQTESYEIKLNSSIAKVKNNEEFFKNIFILVKNIFSISGGEINLHKSNTNLTWQKSKAEISFFEFDNQGIPLKFIVEAPQYKIEVQTTSYQFTKETSRH